MTGGFRSLSCFIKSHLRFCVCLSRVCLVFENDICTFKLFKSTMECRCILEDVWQSGSNLCVAYMDLETLKQYIGCTILRERLPGSTLELVQHVQDVNRGSYSTAHGLDMSCSVDILD